VIPQLMIESSENGDVNFDTKKRRAAALVARSIGSQIFAGLTPFSHPELIPCGGGIH
jgi:hypothetical protein